LLQSDASTFFAERSLVTNFLPNRDVGAQLGGSFRAGAVIYTVGVFNGVADGAYTTNADFDNDKDVIGRVLVQPFKSDASSLLQGLGFGVAGSRGRQKSAAALTSGYKTDGQQVFFRYNSATIADGQAGASRPRRTTIAAIRHARRICRFRRRCPDDHHHREDGTAPPRLAARHRYMLTGEKSAYSGVLPAQSFRPARRDGRMGSHGALCEPEN